jgi:hypothetical protein
MEPQMHTDILGSSAHGGKYPRFGVCVRAKPAHTPQIWGIIPLKPEEPKFTIRSIIACLPVNVIQSAAPGVMAEWTKATDLKSVVAQATGGSNPSHSANAARYEVDWRFFVSLHHLWGSYVARKRAHARQNCSTTQLIF